MTPTEYARAIESLRVDVSAEIVERQALVTERRAVVAARRAAIAREHGIVTRRLRQETTTQAAIRVLVTAHAMLRDLPPDPAAAEHRAVLQDIKDAIHRKAMA